MPVTLGNQNITSSTGNLGIGTSSPQSVLHIVGGVDNANTLLLADLPSSGSQTIDGFVTSQHGVPGEEPLLMIQGRVESGTLSKVMIGGSHLTTTYNVANQIEFYTASGITTVPSERMRITSAGQLRTKVTGSSNVLMDSFGCRAWVNFNGTGTVAIRASGNVSSITDNGTGRYTVNFTTAMTDANYSVVGLSGGSSGSNGDDSAVTLGNVPSSTSQTPAVRFRRFTDNAFVDIEYGSVVVFR